MIKKILVALDPDPDTPIATHSAVEIAHRYDARISGLALVDTRNIAKEVGAGGAIGGMYYAEKVREAVAEKTLVTARELTKAFHDTLEREKLRHGERVEEGVPFQEIVDMMKYHDLLVMGRTAHFYYRRPEKETHTLASVVKGGAVPTLVVGEEWHPIRRVLMTFDGSTAAARTIQQFIHLKPFGEALEFELVHIRESGSEKAAVASELLLRLMGEYLQEHGYQASETSLESDNPGERILSHAEAFGADLIVAGAHSVSAMRRVTFGSTTHTFLEKSDTPLFLFN